MKGACFDLSFSGGATAPASILDYWRTLLGLFADDAKRTSGHNQTGKSNSATQQCVLRCSVGLGQFKKLMEGKKRLSKG